MGPQEEDTKRAIEVFNDAFGRHDVEGVMAAMTPDCVFENTAPPDGVRYRGHDQVRAAWVEFFEASPDAVFETQDCVFMGDRAVVRWTYRWRGEATVDSDHVRGVDLFRVRDGKVVEKCSYVKG